MKPVEPRHEYDCMGAVLAALLELPIDEVPDFWTGDGWLKQHARVARWLARHGYHWYYSDVEPRQLGPFRTEQQPLGSTWPPKGYWIGVFSSVECLRDGGPQHVVVMHRQRCVFNPNGKPSDLDRADAWLIGYFLLVPLDPALKKE